MFAQGEPSSYMQLPGVGSASVLTCMCTSRRPHGNRCIVRPCIRDDAHSPLRTRPRRSQAVVVPQPIVIFCSLLCAAPVPWVCYSSAHSCGQPGSRQTLYSRPEQDGNPKSPSVVCAHQGPGSELARTRQLVHSSP
ncbi:hypothetical protein NDU88_007046 [Pleurodeles waltl]|uniref:Uncharacterized protein n=1 Tax=Pleurodeles waltl TaxID=8319 RepID=A0AAV7ME09_PLEWA|nr:hypothetical protein NDU88_007046 [Pleurodeles waltl]